MTHPNVISVGGTITAIAQTLNHSGKYGSLEPYFLEMSLNIATLVHMIIITTKVGTYKCPH